MIFGKRLPIWSAIRHCSSSLTKFPVVSSTTPIASKPSEVKGVVGVVNQYFYKARIGGPKLIHQCPLFKCFYFPPDHILGLFRKSKPAVRVKFEEGAFINDVSLAKVDKSRFGKSLNPMDYSFMRVKIRRLTRTLFLRRFIDLQGKDGLYVFNMIVLPVGEEGAIEFSKELGTCVEKVKMMKESVFKVEEVNSRVDWYQIKSLLDAEGLGFSDELKTVMENSIKMRKELKKVNSKKRPNRK